MISLGTEVYSTKEKYTMPVLDTAYIRSPYRNKGFGSEILLDIIKRFPDEDIGFSKPISNDMLKGKEQIFLRFLYFNTMIMCFELNIFFIVLKNFLRNYKEYRLRFWEIADWDIYGSQKLIWFGVKDKFL